MTKISIRIATEKDAEAIGILHATSWKSAYRNILPSRFLDDDLESERKKYWAIKMSRLTPGEFVLVAVSDDRRPIGFIAVMDNPEKTYQVLIDNLHVHPDLKGNGIGSKMMKAAAARLSADGIRTAYLWVLKGNDNAERFYQAVGGRPADVSNVYFGGKDVLQTRFVWDHLEDLLK